jgi:short-subunit dehydrogenase
MKLENKNILIVGASKGIGKAIALELANYTNNITLVARDMNNLMQLANQIKNKKSDVHVISADAMDAEHASSVINESVEKFGDIDIAVLVVGGAPPVFTHESKVDTLKKIMELNYYSMLNYFCPIVETMKKKKKGQIVHINSLAGFTIMPGMGPYSAAKSACRSFLDTARAELLSYNIKITNICPGFIKTEGLGNLNPKPLPVMQPDYAAKKIISAIKNQKRELRFPFSINFLIRVSAILPYFLLKNVHLMMKSKKTKLKK